MICEIRSEIFDEQVKHLIDIYIQIISNQIDLYMHKHVSNNL